MPMTNSEKKAWLRRYRVIVLEVEEEMRQAEYFKKKAKSVSASRISFDRIQNRSFTKEDYLVEYLTLMQECGRRFEKALAEKDEIEEAIKRVENQTQEEVLWRRYIDCESFDTIAKKMDYHPKSVLRIHRQAINAIDI